MSALLQHEGVYVADQCQLVKIFWYICLNDLPGILVVNPDSGPEVTVAATRTGQCSLRACYPQSGVSYPDSPVRDETRITVVQSK